MSIFLMSRVFSTSLQPSKKIVLLALADFASDDGKNIFPSVATIALKASLSRRSVQTILAGFVNSGILRVVKNPFGGAPGTTRHLQIDLATLERLTKFARSLSDLMLNRIVRIFLLREFIRNFKNYILFIMK